MKSYRSHLSEKQRKKLLDCFVEDALVSTKPGSMNQKGAAERIGLDPRYPKTAHVWYRYFREAIHAHQTKLQHLNGIIEVDHHTFNARRKKRWRKVGEPDANGKYKYEPMPTRSVLVIGFLQRDPSPAKQHKVYLQIVKRADKKTTQAIVKHVVDPGSVLYSDMWRAFNGLAADYTHKRVNHAKGQYAKRDGDEIVSTATLDRFWRYCEDRIARFNGLAHSTIHLHIQECAFRYNHRHDLRKALNAILD